MPNEFTPKDWANGVEGGTPITAEELERLELGVDSADRRLDDLELAVSNLTARVNAIEASEPPPPTSTTVPQNLTAVTGANNTIILDWDDVPGFNAATDFYKIYEDRSPDGVPSNATPTVSNSTRGPGLPDGNYRYWVTCTKGGVESGISNYAHATLGTSTNPPSGGGSVTTGSVTVFADSFTSGNFNAWDLVQNNRVANTPGSSWDQATYHLQIVNEGGSHTSVARFEVRNGDTWGGATSERSEIIFPDSCDVVSGNTRWYEFDLRLGDPTWTAPVTDNWNIIMQWHAGDGSPPVALNINSQNRIQFVGFGSGNPTPLTIATVDPGVWQSIVLEMKFSTSASTGYVKAWVNGTLTVPQSFRATMSSASNYVKMGTYRRGDHTATQVVEFDNIRVSRN